MHTDYFEDKKFKEILQKFEEAKANGESIYLDSEELTDIAEYYHWKGDIDEAMSVADYALSIFEGATGPLVLKARTALLNDEDPEKAMAFAEQIADKGDLDYCYIKAEILIASGRSAAADIYLETYSESLSTSLYPDFVLDVAILFTDYEQTDLAKKWLEKSTENNIADYQETLGRICYYENRYEECEQIFSQLTEEYPYNAFYWDMLASCQLSMNHLNDSIISSEFAIAINPNDEDALYYKGHALMRLKNYPDAIDYFIRHSKVRKENIEGLYNAALCHIYLDQYKEAIDLLEKAKNILSQKKRGKLIHVYQELAFSYSREGKLDLAFQNLDEMAFLEDYDPYETMVIRGHIYLENGYSQEAQECFRKAVEESEYSSKVIFRVAVSMYDNNFLQLAYEMMEELTDQDKQEIPHAYAYMAICAHDLHQRDAFLKNLKAAMEQAPDAAESILSGLFPEGMDVTDYYQYALSNPNL